MIVNEKSLTALLFFTSESGGIVCGFNKNKLYTFKVFYQECISDVYVLDIFTTQISKKDAEKILTVKIDEQTLIDSIIKYKKK